MRLLTSRSGVRASLGAYLDGLLSRGCCPWAANQQLNQSINKPHRANNPSSCQNTLQKCSWQKKFDTLLDLCVSSLRRGHANLLCIVPILTDDPRRESKMPRTTNSSQNQNQQFQTWFHLPQHHQINNPEPIQLSKPAQALTFKTKSLQTSNKVKLLLGVGYCLSSLELGR